MKKLAVLLCVISVMTGAAMADETLHKVPLKKEPPVKADIIKDRKAKEAAFEQKLGLTEVQKLKAREQRKQGFEKMKPVMDQLKAKRQEADAIQKAKISIEEKEAKLVVIDKEIADLEKQAAVIRKQNMKDFESLLTYKQKRTLKQMKKEGRARFEQHKNLCPPPCPAPREMK